MPVKSFSTNQVNPLGAQPAGKITWGGPASYAQLVPGTVPSGGDGPLTPSMFGLPILTHAFPALSADGQWMVFPVIFAQGQKMLLTWRSTATGSIGGQSQTTGAEAAAATNLSGSQVAILAFGM